MNIQKGEWLNQPSHYQIEEDKVVLTTEPETDFWQKTNYGYCRNTGHVYLFDIEEEEYTFDVKVSFQGHVLYDQCGVMIYNDEKNWSKASLENEDECKKMLGAVVTNEGYSDWSISSSTAEVIESMYYRIHKKDQDFLIETSRNRKDYTQIRMFHLFQTSQVRIGVYACSPLDSSFEATFSEFQLSPLGWGKETHI